MSNYALENVNCIADQYRDIQQRARVRSMSGHLSDINICLILFRSTTAKMVRFWLRVINNAESG